MTLAPGATAWFDVMTFGAKLPWSRSYRKWVSKHWTVILERKFCETSIFTGKGVGDALENWSKRAKKKQQFDAFEDQFEENSLSNLLS